MNELVKKIWSYNLFNYLLPWVLFVIFINQYLNYNLIQENIILGAFLYYFIWLIISRLGSLIIEPLLQYFKIIKYAEYSDFLNAEKNDEKIWELLEVTNMYRTLLAMFISIIVLYLYQWIIIIYPWVSLYNSIYLLILLVILFVFSYRKQVQYISKRVSKFK
jgi:hypothetical protein